MQPQAIYALLIMLMTTAAHAQTVTTLVNDSSKTFEAIHWNPAGIIYAVDFNNGRLYQVSLDGTVETIVTGIPNMAGGGFDAAGNFYFSGLASGTVYRLNEEDGSTSVIATGLNQPTGITAFDAATLLVGQYGNNSVAKVDIASGAVENWISGGGINGPDGIIKYDEDEYLVANFNNSQIHLVDAEGEITDFANLPVNGFMGYITLLDDYVYVASFAGRQIYRVDEDEVMVFAGNGSVDHSDGTASAARFTQPNGIVHSPNGDTLLITDGSRIRMITDLMGVVNVEEQQLVSAFQLGPNPASELLNCSFEVTEKAQLSWSISDAKGQVINRGAAQLYQQGLHKLSIDIDTLPAGNYFLSLQGGPSYHQAYAFVKK
ncbi:MAG: T9SS type A sorting domain-containing protein [Bacteroidota bacterium]